jgi:tRNA(Ile)-lysidine synthase
MISQTVRKTLENFRSHKTYIGFSGGADSVSLLLATKEFAQELDLDITAVHFEHGIRGEASRLDAQWCRDFCQHRKINYEQYDLHTLDERKKNENIEAVARRLRIAKWNELICDQEKCIVLLGHHADDRIENLFIRICRGANVSGLTSLREESVIKNVKFIRPMLSYSKVDLLEFLTERGIAEWCVDHSNFDESYTRNYFRHRIIPEIIEKLPTAATGLIKAAKALEVDALFIEEKAHAKYSLIANENITQLKFWRSLAPALRARVLRYWLSALLKVDFVPTFDLIKRFQDALKQKEGRQILVPLTNGNFIWLHRGEVGLTLDAPVETAECIWNWQSQNTITYDGRTFKLTFSKEFDPEIIASNVTAFDADLLPDELVLSKRKTGDKMIPFGATQQVKLKKLLTERKLTATEKKNLIVLRTNDNTIIWVPTVRHSTFATITKQSTRVAYIEIIKKNDD